MNRNLVINAVWFYAVWLSAVWGRDDFLILTALLLAFHGYKHRQQKIEFALIALVASIGILTDLLLSLNGFYIFQGSGWMPFWLALLWFGFASTLRHSLGFLEKSPILAAIVGAFGGPSSYFAGMKLGAVEFGYDTTLSLCLLAIIWAFLLPMFFQIKHWLSGRLSTQ